MHRPVIGHNSACYRDGHKCLCVNGQPYVTKAEFVSRSTYPGHRPGCFIYDGKCYCESSRPWLVGLTAHDGKVLSPQEVVQLYRSNLLPYKGNFHSNPSEKEYPSTHEHQKIDQETCLKGRTLHKSRLDSEHPSVNTTKHTTAQSLHLQLQVTRSQKMIEPQKSETEQFSVQQSQLSIVQAEVQQAKSSTEQSATQQPKGRVRQSEVQQTKLSTEQLDKQLFKPSTQQHLVQKLQQRTQSAMQQSCSEAAKLKRNLDKHPGRLVHNLDLTGLQKDVLSNWEQQQQRGCILSMPNQDYITYEYDLKKPAIAERTKDRRETQTNIQGDWLTKLSPPNDVAARVANTHALDEVLPGRNKYMDCDLELPDSRLLYPYKMKYPGIVANKPQQLLNLRNWHATSIMNNELLSRATSGRQTAFLQQNGFCHPQIETVHLP